MKIRLTITRFIQTTACAACLVMTASAAYSLTPASLWSKRFGNTGVDVGTSVAVDASGNVYVTGNFEGTVDFGGGNLVSAGNSDVFVARYDAAGVHQWSQRFGSFAFEEGRGVAVDASSNVYVIGNFLGTTNLGGANLVSAGAADIFVAKYNAAGAHQWSQRYGSAGGEEGRSIAVDASSNVVTTGIFSSTVDFGGGNLVSAGVFDIFVAKYNAAGSHQWSQRFGSGANEYSTSVAVDASGAVFVTGQFNFTVNFGGGNLVASGIASDIFIAKYNATGAHQWSQRFGSTQDDVGYAVAVDASGNVFATGFFRGTVNFGGGNLVSAGSFDIFVAKYNAAGTHQWSKRFGSTGNDNGFAIAADATGNVLVTGYFNDTVDFGGGNFVSAGPNDFFVAKYSATGVHQWSARAGAANDDTGYAIAVDASGSVFTTGYFHDTVNFGGGNLVSAGSHEMFLAKHASDPAEPVISAITDVGNDQGHRVNIRFGRTGYDAATSATQIVSYEAYRRDDPPPAASFVSEQSSRPELLDLGWTFVGEAPAHGQVSYALDASTIGDSTVALGPYNSTFFIRATTGDPHVYFDSPQGAGYSLDNLAPGAPENFIYNGGDLSWNESADADFDFFTVYGSNADAFGTATVVDYSVDPAMDVSASTYAFYYLTATDRSGNESAPAKVTALAGVSGAPKSYVLSVANYPNPFNPRTTVSYTIPSRGTVSIVVYDAQGARVATLFSGERAAGAYSIEWDGRTDGAAVAASGVYFARIEHASGTRSKKMLLLK